MLTNNLAIYEFYDASDALDNERSDNKLLNEECMQKLKPID